MASSNLYFSTVPQFKKMLFNLDQILGKASQYCEIKKVEPAVYCQLRLAPDQFPLVKQVQIACDTAKLAVSRLTGQQAPVHDDSERTISDLRHRIQDTISFLEKFTEKDFTASLDLKITQPRWEGKSMAAWDFVHSHAIPNLYFHVATAYSIMRKGGLEIGKKDYSGELPFLK